MLSIILDFLKDFAVWLVVFGGLLAVSMRFGIDMLRTIAVALYLSVLVWLMFPERAALVDIAGDTSLTRAGVFALLFAGVLFLTKRMLPGSFDRPVEFLHKKSIYALAVSVLVIIIGAHILPVTTPQLLNSAPLMMLFGNPEYSFYWFIAPLAIITLL